MSRTLPQPEVALAEVALDLPLRRTFTYSVPEALAAEVEIGAVVRVPFGRRRLFGIVDAVPASTELTSLREIEAVLGEPYRLRDHDRDLARWVSDYYACAPGEAMSLLLPPRPGTKARRHPVDAGDGQAEVPPEPTPEQLTCLEIAGKAVREGRNESFLLHGITGSGKTEVYLRLIEEALTRGRSALVLLPEIALTPQTLRRLQRRFPGRVAPYHSRLSHGERCAVWESAARGELSILVGARSATFVPLPELGLIVVDEEHDGSYKADDRPRYHARDVALLRGALQSVPVVLGSATPSLESWHNAETGKHTRLGLSTRVHEEAVLPTVEVCDLRKDDPRDRGILSPTVIQGLEEALGRGEQVIVFHNRRGYARWLQCHACGHVIECPRCDISLTLHLVRDRLQCHYCGYDRPVPDHCGECETEGLRQHGTGTQRVEVALETLFPEAGILRLDQDSTTRKHAHAEILDAFATGEAEILVGTQMVAKGLHLPRVSLVVIVDADVGLHFPDFRAHERAFQLLTQVAGRSGRVGPGRVLVQTYDPEHRVLAAARHHDVEGFLRVESAERQALAYPPFSRLSTVLVSANTAARLDAALDWLDGALRTALGSSPITILGPARAALPRINRRYRGQLLLKGALSASAKAHLLDLFDELKSRPGASALDLALDVDPQHLL